MSSYWYDFASSCSLYHLLFITLFLDILLHYFSFNLGKAFTGVYIVLVMGASLFSIFFAKAFCEKCSIYGYISIVQRGVFIMPLLFFLEIMSYGNCNMVIWKFLWLFLSLSLSLPCRFHYALTCLALSWCSLWVRVIIFLPTNMLTSPFYPINCETCLVFISN